MSRPWDRDRRPARAPASRAPRLRLLVVCEGARTEPEYLRALRDHARNPLVDVHLPAERGEPLRLVQIAAAERDRAAERARRERDPSLAFDEVWCVFDRDAHERFDRAVQSAQDQGTRLAVSTPCFELWLLLHLRESPGPRTPDELVRMLKAHAPGQPKTPPWSLLAPGLPEAEARAERLARDAERRGDGPFENPSTGVFRLTRQIAGTGTPAEGG